MDAGWFDGYNNKKDSRAANSAIFYTKNQLKTVQKIEHNFAYMDSAKFFCLQFYWLLLIIQLNLAILDELINNKSPFYDYLLNIAHMLWQDLIGGAIVLYPVHSHNFGGQKVGSGQKPHYNHKQKAPSGIIQRESFFIRQSTYSSH